MKPITRHLPNPYETLDADKRRRLNSNVSSDDWDLIVSVCPYHGFLNAFVSSQLKSLADEIRKRNWTIANVDQFFAYCRQRLSPCEPNGEKPLCDDGRGVGSVRKPTKGDKAVKPNRSGNETGEKVNKAA